MGFGADVAAALPDLAVHAESLMRDTCEIRAKAAKGAADTTTGVRTSVAGVLRYTGICRVRRADNLAGNDERAEQIVGVARYAITITADAVVYPTDVVTVTASDDPRLTSGTFTIVEMVEGTIRFQRRLLCTRDT